MSGLSNFYRRSKVIDHYFIVRSLSHGPAGRTYLALDRDTGAQIVMKFPNDDEIGGAQIYRHHLLEVELSRYLRHSAIVAPVNPDETRSTNYLVLEYLDGKTLRELLSTGPLATAATLDIFIPLCEVLVYVHSQGVIHRDIKPENVMLLTSGGIKLIDFGIAEIEKTQQHPRFGATPLVGTPDYMSPERLLGRRSTPLADVYAVGIMLYETLSGRLPFREQESSTLFNPQVSLDPPDILLFAPTVPAPLSTVVMRSIRRDPARRYQSISALLYDLQHLDSITPQPYIADPPRRIDIYWQVLRVVLIIVIICLLIFALGYLAQLVHNARP